MSLLLLPRKRRSMWWRILHSPAQALSMIHAPMWLWAPWRRYKHAAELQEFRLSGVVYEYQRSQVGRGVPPNPRRMTRQHFVLHIISSASALGMIPWLYCWWAGIFTWQATLQTLAAFSMGVWIALTEASRVRRFK